MTARIPATVVTGFLGAGKTTLIASLLANAAGRRIALIVNEFGDVGLDRETLMGQSGRVVGADEIIELANGCICCTVADDFLPSLDLLLTRDPAPDHIVIETSGLALPLPLIAAFDWPGIRDRVTVDGVVTVVDSRAVADGRFATHDPDGGSHDHPGNAPDAQGPLRELFDDQVGCADLIVLNKSDLVTPDERERVAQMLERKRRANSRIVEARHAEVPATLLLGLGAGAEADLAARHSHGHDHPHEPHDHDAFESFVFRLGPVRDVRDLSLGLAQIMAGGRVLRAKGLVAVEGEDMRLSVQAVGDRVDAGFDRAWRANEPRDGQLVVIGLKGLDREAIARILNAGAL